MEAVMDNAVKWTAVRTKIIAAVLHYQNNHRGLSPTDEMIAIESGLSRDLVRSQMREMENEGLLTDSKRWPRMIRINREDTIDKFMDVIDPRQAPPNDNPQPAKPAKSGFRYTKAMASRGGTNRWKNVTPEQRSAHMRLMAEKRWANKDKKASQVVSYEEEKMAGSKLGRKEIFTKKPFFERAKQIAHIIDEYTDAHNGIPPSGEDIREKIREAYGVQQMPSCSLISRASKMMVEEGWLEHKPGYQRDYRLTNLGRTALLHSSPVERVVMDAPIIPPKAAPEPRTALPRPIVQPEVTIRGYRPETAPTAPQMNYITNGTPDLSGVDSMDLAIELQRRGFRVTR